VVIEGSEVKTQEPCQTTNGTSLAIKNLFFNIPARRNFLKSNPVETRHIIAEFQRVALANPDIHFEMFQETSELFHLKAGNLRQRITGLFGDQYNEKLVPVEEVSGDFKIFGFIGKPEFAKKTRGEQYFFVNKRFIKNPYLNHAVFNVYQDYISKDSYPFFVLFIELDPASVDINVHPTKTEVKFTDDRLIYTFINAGVKHSLGAYNITPTLDFDQEQGFGSHSGFQSFPGSGGSIETSVSGAGKRSGNLAFMPEKDRPQEGWEDLYTTAMGAGEKLTVTIASKNPDEDTDGTNLTEDQEIAKTKYLVQLHHKYILSQIKSGFILINQQFAHERILFEKFQRQLSEGKKPSQTQLFPEKMELSEEDKQILLEILPDINTLGFDVQEFGHNTFIIQGIPADIPAGDEREIIEKLIEQFKTNTKVVKLNKRDNIARSLALSSAIKVGKPLQPAEMTQLVDELFACQNPYIAPNGKFVFVSFDLHELDRRFANEIG
jgi:DNA mismatch repair protein MutL